MKYQSVTRSIIAFFLAFILTVSVIPCYGTTDDEAAAAADNAGTTENEEEKKGNSPSFTDSITDYSAKSVPSVNAEGVLLVEANTQQVIYAKNANTKMYPASTTKIMTALLAYEAFGDENLDTVHTATNKAVYHSSLVIGGTSAGIQVGEELTIRQLLYCLLLPSGNDAACVLAEAVSGNVEDFVELMNQRAVELGCTNTHFANPHGLTDENHYTTPHDLYCIAYEFAKSNTLMELANTTSITIPATNKYQERVLNTTNHLISTRTKSQYFYEYARGIKTGYTSASKHCLVTTAQKDDMYLICVVMKCPVIENKTVTSFTNSKSLYEWAFSTYELKTIVKKGTSITEAYVSLSDDKDAVILETDRDIGVLIPKGSYDESLLSINPPENVVKLTAPIEKGELVAEASVVYNDIDYGKVGLVTASDASLSEFMDVNAKADSFFKSSTFIFILILIPILFVIYIIYISITSKKRRKKSLYHRKYR